jgi:hypothetical protein
MTMFECILCISLGCGVTFFLLTPIVYRKAINWKIDLEGPAWDFTRSWASNLTVAGSVLGYASLFSATGVNTKIAPRMIFMVLAALAAGLALAPPLVFSAFKRILSALGCSFPSCIAFLLASSMTCTAISAQIALGGSLVWELHCEQAILPSSVALGLEIAGSVFLIMTIWYAILSAGDVLKTPPIKPAVAGGGVQWTLL